MARRIERQMKEEEERRQLGYGPEDPQRSFGPVASTSAPAGMQCGIPGGRARFDWNARNPSHGQRSSQLQVYADNDDHARNNNNNNNNNNDTSFPGRAAAVPASVPWTSLQTEEQRRKENEQKPAQWSNVRVCWVLLSCQGFSVVKKVRSKC
eukprot:jgi/Chlat1/3713/Chrsp251S03867